MKNFIFIILLSSTTVFAGNNYNGKVMIICDTAKTQYAIIESANNIQIKDGVATLSSNSNADDKEATKVRTLDLKEMVECRFEAETGSDLFH